MIRPILNNNGTSADGLINPRIKAMDLLLDVIAALKDIAPNGRDYQLDNEQCTLDREVHFYRITELRDLRDELMREAIYIKEQVA